jgi:ribosomal protein L34E
MVDYLLEVSQATIKVDEFFPSLITLMFRSTRNQCGDCGPILATVRLYRILQLAVFDGCKSTRTSSRQGDVRIQDILPSAPTLMFRSTRNQCGDCGPILATVRLYRILQLDVFLFCPFARTTICPVEARIQDILPSIQTLFCRSTRNQCGDCGKILATVRLYCILQLDVFVFCPSTRKSIRPVDARFQDIMPSTSTLFCRSIRNERSNQTSILATVR